MDNTQAMRMSLGLVKIWDLFVPKHDSVCDIRTKVLGRCSFQIVGSFPSASTGNISGELLLTWGSYVDQHDTVCDNRHVHSCSIVRLPFYHCIRAVALEVTDFKPRPGMRNNSKTVFKNFQHVGLQSCGQYWSKISFYVCEAWGYHYECLDTEC